MEQPEEEPIFLYETLDFLPLSTDTEASQPEPYSVFRNQITASVSETPGIAATDYFSLDAIEDARPQTPSKIPSKPGPSRQDPTLERAWFRPEARFKSPMLQLHKEILDFSEFISPTQEEQASRASAVQRVFEVVKYIWPNCRVEVFGSFKTGLYLPTSDIDVVVLESNIRSPQMGLQALAKALSQKGIAKKIQVIAKARVPIIKFVEKESGVAFDISFDVLNGPNAAVFIKDFLTKIPPLRPLCLILKVFLQQRELNEVYSGGIGSYALLAMLIAYLQMHWRGQDIGGHDHKGSKTSLEHNLGILLVKFFEFYGRKLNTCDVGISCHRAGTFFLKSNKGFLEKSNLLAIEDPQAPDNDIGKNSYNFFQIKSAFSMAYSSLTDAKTIVGFGTKRSILGTIIRPDPLLLLRKGGCNGELTFNSLLPGAGEPLGRQHDNEQEMLCNWQLYDEEPLPRENGIAVDDIIRSSGKKRPRPSKRQRLAAARARGSETPDGEGKDIERETKKKRSEEKVRKKEMGLKKSRRRRYSDG